MDELVLFLNQINERRIPASTTFCQDFIDILKLSKNTSVDNNVARDFLKSKGLYSTEEDLQFFMRDLHTQYVVLTTEEHRNQLKKMINSYLLTAMGKVNMSGVRELMSRGFRCYPVTFTQAGPVIGIMTEMGIIIVEPAQ
jgi:hypothetical protein